GPCGQRLLIHRRFRKFREFRVSDLLLLLVRPEKIHGILVPKELRPRYQAAICDDLVVLDPLTSGNEGRIQYGFITVFLQQITAFFENAGHSGAMLPFWLQIERFEGLLEAGDMTVRFLEMRRE